MLKVSGIREVTETECKSELDLYLSDSPPTAVAVCETLRLCSEECPAQVTPAAAAWAAALYQIGILRHKNDFNAEAGDAVTTSPMCNGHVERRVSAGDAMASDVVKCVEEASKTLLAHLKRLSLWVRDTGCVDQLYAVLASAELISFLLNFAVTTASSSTDVSRVRHQLTESSQLVLQLTEQLHSWHRRQLADRLLTDPGSQDWQHHHAGEEGERCSFSIQWWWFHMQAVRHDLKHTLSSRSTTNLFGELLTTSLGQLTANYGQVELVSEERQAQFHRDVITLLLCASELVFTVADSPDQLFSCANDDVARLVPAQKVAAQCRVLCLLLGHLTAPLKLMSKKCGRDDLHIQAPPASWLSFIRPQLIPPDTSHSQLNNNTLAYLLVRIISASYPSPACWSVLTQALTARDFYLAVVLLTNLCEQGASGRTSSTDIDVKTSCGACLCCEALDGGCVTLSSATHQQVFSAAVLVVSRASATSATLVDILAPCVSSSNERLPDLWTHHRPVWLQALVDLAKPIVQTVVETLVEDVEQDVPKGAEARAEIVVQYCADVVEDLPRPLLLLELSSPKGDAKCVSSSKGDLTDRVLLLTRAGTVAHVVLSALYDSLTDEEMVLGLVSCGQERRVGDALLAVSEQFIHPKESLQKEITYLTKSIQTAAVFASAHHEEVTFPDEILSNPRLMTVSAADLAARVAHDHHGRRALWVLSAVVRENATWWRKKLGIAPLLGGDAEDDGGSTSVLSLRLRDEKVFWPQAAMFSLGGCQFDHEKLAVYHIDWRALLTCDLGQSETLVKNLLQRRWEMREDATLSEEQVELVNELKQRLQLA